MFDIWQVESRFNNMGYRFDANDFHKFMALKEVTISGGVAYYDKRDVSAYLNNVLTKKRGQMARPAEVR